MYQDDRKMADSYTSQVISILMQLLPHLVELNTASIEKDTKCATDFTIRLKGGDIAVRLRRPKYSFRDLTIRAHRDTGMKTELAKMREGYGTRYFYGWIDKDRIISEWILVNLDRVRKTGLLEKPRDLKDNHDGTYFIAISTKELDETGCVLARQLRDYKTPRQVNTQASLQRGIERAKQVKCYQPMIWEDEVLA